VFVVGRSGCVWYGLPLRWELEDSHTQMMAATVSVTQQHGSGRSRMIMVKWLDLWDVGIKKGRPFWKRFELGKVCRDLGFCFCL